MQQYMSCNYSSMQPLAENAAWTKKQPLKKETCYSFCLCIGLYRNSVCQCLKVKVTQSCRTLCNPMDYTVHGILQARILEWVDFPFSRGSSQPRGQTQVSCTAGRFLHQLCHKGSPRLWEWVAYPFSRRSSQPRNQTGVSCVAGGFFTN